MVEASETAFLRLQTMRSEEELKDITERGLVCDTLGRLFDAWGRVVDRELGRRTVAAIQGLLRAGLVAGLITDGDTARHLAGGAEDARPHRTTVPDERIGLGRTGSRLPGSPAAKSTNVARRLKLAVRTWRPSRASGREAHLPFTAESGRS